MNDKELCAVLRILGYQGLYQHCFHGLCVLCPVKQTARSHGVKSGGVQPPCFMTRHKHEVAHGSLRLSLSEYNTEEDVNAILKAVPEVVAYLRNMSPVWEDLETGKKQHLI